MRDRLLWGIPCWMLLVACQASTMEATSSTDRSSPVVLAVERYMGNNCSNEDKAQLIQELKTITTDGLEECVKLTFRLNRHYRTIASLHNGRLPDIKDWQVSDYMSAISALSMIHPSARSNLVDFAIQLQGRVYWEPTDYRYVLFALDEIPPGLENTCIHYANILISGRYKITKHAYVVDSFLRALGKVARGQHGEVYDYFIVPYARECLQLQEVGEGETYYKAEALVIETLGHLSPSQRKECVTLATYAASCHKWTILDYSRFLMDIADDFEDVTQRHDCVYKALRLAHGKNWDGSKYSPVLRALSFIPANERAGLVDLARSLGKGKKWLPCTYAAVLRATAEFTDDLLLRMCLSYVRGNQLHLASVLTYLICLPENKRLYAMHFVPENGEFIGKKWINDQAIIIKLAGESEGLFAYWSKFLDSPDPEKRLPLTEIITSLSPHAGLGKSHLLRRKAKEGF